MLEWVEYGQPAPADLCIICLHGLGADGYDFLDPRGGTPLGITTALKVHFLFPHAPLRKITWANNSSLRGWFNITRLDAEFQDDAVGLEQSSQLIQELIDHQVANRMPSHRIILAGFSQGGVAALHTGLRHPLPLGGIIAFSAWLPLKERLLAEKSSANLNTPIFLGHGRYDELIPITWAQHSYQHLTQLGYQAQFHEYPMGHTICAQELQDFNHWLTRVLQRETESCKKPG